MEDNEIAVLRLVAGEEVEEEIDDAERVENCADGDAPKLGSEVLVERIHERCVEEQRITHKSHERAPAEPGTSELRAETTRVGNL